MAKSTQEQFRIDTQIENLGRQIHTCEKFISLTGLTGITIIFAGTYQGTKTVDLIKIEQPGMNNVPVKHLFHFFEQLSINLHTSQVDLQNKKAFDSLQGFNESFKKHR